MQISTTDDDKIFTGYRESRHAREGMGVLQLCGRRRDHEPGESCCVPPDMVETAHLARRNQRGLVDNDSWTCVKDASVHRMSDYTWIPHRPRS